MSNEIDQETLNLIIELQLQDAQRRQVERPDAELALQLYCSELESLGTTYSDHAMSRSMAHAALTDGDFIRNHLEEEQQAVRDREYAIHGQLSAVVPVIATPDTVIEDGMLQKLAALYNGVDDGRSSVVGEPSSRQTTWAGQSSSATMNGRCVASRLFKAAMSDESLFPPRCCGQSIPLGSNEIFLPAELVREYRAKELEYSTPNRTYCYRPSCSAFIPQQSIQGDKAHAAAALSFATGMKIGWSVERMLSLIGMRMDVNWRESSGLFLWNKQETTWFKTISARIGAGDLAAAPFDAISVRPGCRTASTNAVIVAFWVAEGAGIIVCENLLIPEFD
ncbi:uncharacterized protein Triagg1_262 [Trichoderma aggressivum f. europaeum]|uniref:Uncharacterized protein n=1 Tax=Trichoderma aggressivum f. europaeum TaxID=173218 RepID=A0AAE1IK24_9HYPO|nr:hypothetical protein Triagg1_262 [Trichoderma aggressivum f. europaeum]